MNPYFASRMAHERMAEDQRARRRGAGGGPTRGLQRAVPEHAVPAGALPALPVRPLGGTRSGTSPAGRPGRRLRTTAGWLLVEAGLRLAVGRRAALPR